MFVFPRPHKAEVSADGVSGLVEGVDSQSSPEERLGGQTLLYSGRQKQVLLNLSLILFEPRDSSAELFFRLFLFRNISQRYYREVSSIGPGHRAHADDDRYSPAVLRGQEKLFASPPQLPGFLVERLGESELLGSVIQLPGVSADDLAARESGHFFEDGVDKKNLIRIVCNDDAVIQRFKNLLHLLQRLPGFAVHESPHLGRSDPWDTQLVRLALETVQNMLDIHIAGDKLRALAAHAPQHSFTALVDERDFIEVHDALSLLRHAARPVPVRLQFLNPWSDKATLQCPPLFLRRIGDRDLQHFFLLPHGWPLQT